MIRLLKHIKQVDCSKMICKHCEQDFNFKNKLHDHIREQHTQKSNFRIFTSESTYKTEKKSTIICLFVSLVSSSFFATSRSQIFSSKIVSRFVSSSDSNFPIATHKFTFKFMKKSVPFASSASSIFFATSTSISESISSKCSNFFIATLNITSKSMKKLSVNCSFTFSISFFRTFVSKHSYLTIDNLIRMFREKFKSFDLQQHRKDFAFSQRFDIRSFRQSRFFSMHQSRIIFYFMFAINQKTSINQNLKSSNSKSFQQFTFAKTIRFVLFEKSIISSYKKSNIFYISLQSRFSFLQSRFSFA